MKKRISFIVLALVVVLSMLFSTGCLGKDNGEENGALPTLTELQASIEALNVRATSLESRVGTVSIPALQTSLANVQDSITSLTALVGSVDTPLLLGQISALGILLNDIEAEIESRLVALEAVPDFTELQADIDALILRVFILENWVGNISVLELQSDIADLQAFLAEDLDEMLADLEEALASTSYLDVTVSLDNGLIVLTTYSSIPRALAFEITFTPVTQAGGATDIPLRDGTPKDILAELHGASLSYIIVMGALSTTYNIYYLDSEWHLASITFTTSAFNIPAGEDLTNLLYFTNSWTDWQITVKPLAVVLTECCTD